MDFDAVLAQLRAWCGEVVTIVLEPDHSIMRGRLREIDSRDVDGAMFAVVNRRHTTTGVALALFRDAVASARQTPDALYVRQGRIDIIVRPQVDIEVEAGAQPAAH